MEKVKIDTSLREGQAPELLIIFSHPTKDDLEVRRFGEKGYTADEVKAALSNADIPLDRVHFTGMVKHGIGSKSKPSAEDIEEWSASLDAEIEAIKPKLIMPMGAEVFKRVMRSNIKMGDYIGELTDTPYGKVMANYSAGMIVVMDPTKRPEFRDIFVLAKRVLDGTLEYDKFNYFVIDEPADNIKFLQSYISRGMFDIG